MPSRTNGRKVAMEFNEKLDTIRNLDPSTPRVSFLDCSVYYLDDDKQGEYAVVVERRLDTKFQKWNNNNGWKWSIDNLESIPETVKKEEGTDEIISIWQINNNVSRVGTICASEDEVAQAFSHFSHVNSGKQLLICDLQGNYDKFAQKFRFTDPVIHYRSTKDSTKKGIFGRTDKGHKGINNFFKTHQCSDLCELVTKGFRRARCKTVTDTKFNQNDEFIKIEE